MRPTIPTHPDTSDVLWLPDPEIPAGCAFRWAGADEIDSQGLDLSDPTVLTELLYSSALDPALPVTAEGLREAVLKAAEACGCDLSGPVGRIAQDASDHPQACVERVRWLRSLVVCLPELAAATTEGEDR
jgi:hypothetical protein